MGQEQSKLSPEELKNREIQRVDREIRRKLNKGAQYNMKVVIRGARNVGKTCLMRRLQGQPFTDAYTPSNSITTAQINWNYKATDDVVLVEVWDVVDQGRGAATGDLDEGIDHEQQITRSLSEKQMQQQQALQAQQQGHGSAQLGAMQGSHHLTVLDASLIDVYKHTNAAILVFDITKRWSFDYVKNEIPKIPTDVDILILANAKDLDGHRTVSAQEVHELLSSNKRRIWCMECSMKNNFGLRQLYTYLNYPFLKLKMKALQQQLRDVAEELVQAEDEITLHIKSQNYNEYVELMKTTKKKTPPVQLGTVVQPQAPQASVSQQKQASPIESPTSPTIQQQAQPKPQPQLQVQPQPQSQPQPKPQQAQSSGGGFRSMFSKVFSGGNKAEAKPAPNKPAAASAAAATATSPQAAAPLKSAADFNVGEIDEGFFGGDGDDFYADADADDTAAAAVDDTRQKQASSDEQEPESAHRKHRSHRKSSSRSSHKSHKSSSRRHRRSRDSSPETSDNEKNVRPMQDEDIDDEEIAVSYSTKPDSKTKRSSPEPTKKAASPEPAPAPVTQFRPDAGASSFYSDDDDNTAANQKKKSSGFYYDDDDSEPSNAKAKITTNNDDDSDDSGPNPMVAQDVDLDDSEISYDNFYSTVPKRPPPPVTTTTRAAVSPKATSPVRSPTAQRSSTPTAAAAPVEPVTTATSDHEDEVEQQDNEPVAVDHSNEAEETENNDFVPTAEVDDFYGEEPTHEPDAVPEITTATEQHANDYDFGAADNSKFYDDDEANDYAVDAVAAANTFTVPSSTAAFPDEEADDHQQSYTTTVDQPQPIEEDAHPYDDHVAEQEDVAVSSPQPTSPLSSSSSRSSSSRSGDKHRSSRSSRSSRRDDDEDRDRDRDRKKKSSRSSKSRDGDRERERDREKSSKSSSSSRRRKEKSQPSAATATATATDEFGTDQRDLDNFYDDDDGADAGHQAGDDEYQEL